MASLITKVLIAEDESTIREELVECLTNEGFDCIQASNGHDGLNILRQDIEITIVLSDIVMPQKSGLEMISDAQPLIDDDRNLEFIILTGHGGSKEAIDALNLGAIDFLEKPIDLGYLIHVVRRAEELVILKRTSRQYEALLQQDIQAKTRQIRKILGNLDSVYGETLERLEKTAEHNDLKSGGNIFLVREYAQVLAKALGWSKERQSLMLLAAPLFGPGKISELDSRFLKSYQLDFDNPGLIKSYALDEYDTRLYSELDVMRVTDIILKNQHERWDGSGYPLGIKGVDIPIEARIFALAEAYNALRSKQHYKPAFEQKKTLSILFNGNGATKPMHFDPELIEILKQNSEKFNEIYLRWAD
jgi:putative two-component system response regulator